MCEIHGCENEVNRDGLCFKHKVKTLQFDTHQMTEERRGTDLTEGRGMSTYVREMYENRRAQGLPDPEPANKKAARYAPKTGKVM